MSRDLTIARKLIQRGQPLPIDLETRLIAEGVDLDKLQRRYER